METTNPQLSVIVPMYNAASMIRRCLEPLLGMLDRGEIKEIIVVNDGSTDQSAEVVASIPRVQLIRTPAQSGPGAARNLGAELASGSHLWFVDSDVIVTPESARVIRSALCETGAGAVFGCYDDHPAALNFLSQYKNLVHRYYHARGKEDASTFWAGCGAVERGLFRELGGFDAQRYRYPSIEDIELGYRIVDAGRRIVLRSDLQGKHLKEWRLRNLLHTEVFRRAIPWSDLMLERKHLTNDLNVGTGERVRAALSLAWLLAILAWLVGLAPGWVAPAGLLACLAANLDLIRFFATRRGALFAERAFLYHQFYYVYSSAAFVYSTLPHLISSPRKAFVPPRLP